MKKTIIATLLSAAVLAPAGAQNYKDSRYYDRQTGRLEYGKQNGRSTSSYRYARTADDSKSPYIGFRIGPSFTTVSSDDPYLDGGSMKTGLNVGIAVAAPVSYSAPLYLESGLSYTEKGGKGKNTDNRKFTDHLNYLEIPLVFKYRHAFDEHFKIEPYFGGYFAVGVGGKIKDFANREAHSSFSDDADGSFRRCDGGLRFGVGASYDMFYMELGYDLGLANICHDTFDTSRNGALLLNFGVNL